jgi:hypothetical protein
MKKHKRVRPAVEHGGRPDSSLPGPKKRKEIPRMLPSPQILEGDEPVFGDEDLGGRGGQ